MNTVTRDALMSAHDHRSELSHGTITADRHKTPLVGALPLTGGFLAVGVVGAFWTGSLALLADAGHMFTNPGWYQYPPATVAELASANELERDGLSVKKPFEKE